MFAISDEMTSTVQDDYTKSHGDRSREPLGTRLSYGSQPEEMAENFTRFA